ncbi:conserved hypothetical protein [Magnetococcus marinus MC-1]|uniref:Cytochrome c domain-containing protein n=1 Tax=Magnetococcus marinus (strain ATCC BAA-1437 / JCM 17883 / MC-1) TaxID=156889 RepID=A0L535_MAGMM|nr:hypothetical protein [Magnetococcus marinus]ABK43078.1 conserved hypothetical protein [Magnetococcus marinus MC-1]
MKVKIFMAVAMLGLLSGQTAAADEGKVLHDESCIACHASRFNGQAEQMYTRAERKKNSYASLKQMVAFCNNQVGTGWFDEEVGLVTDHLNRTYYKFPKP